MTTKLEAEKINVTLVGITGVMFDPFRGQEKDTKPPETKFYFGEGDIISMPSENIYAFLFSENPAGCAKSIEGKGYREYARFGHANIIIEPWLIPFTRDGEPIKFTGFDDKSCYISEFAPRTKLGSLSIKQNIKQRPVLLTPWELKFTVNMIKNTKINRDRLFNWFTQGGMIVGLGTYRPRFGRFAVKFD